MYIYTNTQLPLECRRTGWRSYVRNILLSHYVNLQNEINKNARWPWKKHDYFHSFLYLFQLFSRLLFCYFRTRFFRPIPCKRFSYYDSFLSKPHYLSHSISFSALSLSFLYILTLRWLARLFPLLLLVFFITIFMFISSQFRFLIVYRSHCYRTSSGFQMFFLVFFVVTSALLLKASFQYIK